MGSHPLACLFIRLCILQGLQFWFGILGKCFHSHRSRDNYVRLFAVLRTRPPEVAWERLFLTPVLSRSSCSWQLHPLCGTELAFLTLFLLKVYVRNVLPCFFKGKNQSVKTVFNTSIKEGSLPRVKSEGEGSRPTQSPF